MTSDQFANLADLAGGIDLISTDVFDTLLLRKGNCERSRIMQGERLFSNLLAAQGWHIDADLLVSARIEAQRLAFRALTVRGAGEVRIADIITRQLGILGLPRCLTDERLNVEVQVEKASLVASKPLAAALRALRGRHNAGMRIVAVSDTTFSSRELGDLIRHFHGPQLIDQIYTSADFRRTKRDGDLFLAVAEAEKVSLNRVLHIGDDPHADVQTPSAHGISVFHAPRSRYHRYARMANGALTEARRLVSRRTRYWKATTPLAEDAHAFGQLVLGPIATQFCLLIWLYAAQVEALDQATLLFCARGGIGIREVFERVLARLGLPLAMPRENIMISRLVAARAALLARSDSALQELSREFRVNSFAEVANALGGRAYRLADKWQQPFSAHNFLKLLFGETGGEVLADIQTQNALFVRHFATLRGNATRIVLCDTGLYGSTQRLLASAFPEIGIESIQFARANYKGHGEEHFSKLAGLLVEQNYYSPFNVHSCVLRYWHLIESLFEPAIPSVRSFAEDGQGEVTANCGDIRSGSVDPALGNYLLSGALSYADALPINGGAVALGNAEVAWLRLKKAIARPTPADLRCLEIGGRSVDFGRSDVLRVLSVAQRKPWASKLTSLRDQLWREGAIAREFPVLKHALLPMLESVHSLRGVLARQH
jgi:FMN phosphatase YigB (HAD superfamily)